MKYCPYCGKDVQANDRFCLACGSTLNTGNQDDEQANNPGLEADDVPPVGKHCSTCGLKVANDVAYCQGCGADLAILEDAGQIIPKAGSEPDQVRVEQVFCGGCGASMQADDLFCPGCGASTLVAPIPSTPAATSSRATNAASSIIEPDHNVGKKVNIWFIIIPVMVVAVAVAWYFLFGFGGKEDKPMSGSANVNQSITSPAAADTSYASVANESVRSSSEPEVTNAAEPAQSARATVETPNQKASERVSRTAANQKATASPASSQQPSGGSAIKAASTAQKAKKVVIFSNWNDLPVRSNPSRPVRFEIDKAYLVTSITTRHYNDGKGVKAGGTISIVDEKRKNYGTWTSKTKPDRSGTPDALFVFYPNIRLPAGKYRIINSGEKTWSFNLESGRRGMTIIEGQLIE